MVPTWPQSTLDGENDWISGRMEENTHYPNLYNYWIGMKLDPDASDSSGL